MYDSARTNVEDLPRSYAELGEWIQENPGRFTYIAPGPGAFQGTRFVNQMFFELCGGRAAFDGPFNQEQYDECAPLVWEMLNSWEPYLWREGETYPANATEMIQLFANGEIDLAITQRGTGAAAFIAVGEVPESTRAYTFSENSIADFSYVAIPFNAPNKAAALVLANLILRPDMQAAQLVPENGAGFGLAIDPNRIEDADALTAINETISSIVGVADVNELASAAIGTVGPEYQVNIEADWQANVLQQ